MLIPLGKFGDSIEDLQAEARAIREQSQSEIQPQPEPAPQTQNTEQSPQKTTLNREFLAGGMTPEQIQKIEEQAKSQSTIQEKTETGQEQGREHLLPNLFMQSITDAERVAPKVGDRVVFRPYGEGEGKYSYTGTVKNFGEKIIDGEAKETVTLKCGERNVTLFTDMGTFFEAPPLTREESKEYAMELAIKHARQSGGRDSSSAYFAREEGFYKGTIVDTTPTYAIQEVARGITVLHRLKDLGEDNLEKIQTGIPVSIDKKDGKVTVKAIERTQQQTQSQGQWR
jgi:hypothetical protein